VTPVEALQRAAYLLDRGVAPSRKVRAFLRAAEVVADTDPDELATLAAAGRLESLPGVGPSTGSVVADALAGRPSGYLERLERETTVAVGEGADLLAALRGDCHSHTTWSDGGASVAAMAGAAAALGREYLVVTDHSPRLTVAHGLSRERLEAQLDEIDRVNRELAPFRVLTGIEVDILDDGSLDQDDDLLHRLDVVVASAHSALRTEPRAMTRRLVAAVRHPAVDVLGHCTNRKLTGRGRPPSTFDVDAVFAACAEAGTAVEINCRPDRLDPPDELVARALDHGCSFTIDTDAHAPGQLEWLAHGCDIAARAGVPAERVLNALPVDDLLAATGA
jgi:putative hydrolase